MIAPYFSELARSIGTTNLVLIISGGVLYSIGAVCYALKWPALKPDFFGYHEVFHVLVALAAGLHFAVIFSLVS